MKGSAVQYNNNNNNNNNNDNNNSNNQKKTLKKATKLSIIGSHTHKNPPAELIRF